MEEDGEMSREYIYPKNSVHFKKLILFAQEIIKICRENGVDPVIYGSFAHIYHTKDRSLTINDIDLIISKGSFSKIRRALKINIKAEIISDGGTIVVKKGNLIVELDSPRVISEKDLVKRNFEKVDFYGAQMRIAALSDLEKIYPLAYTESVRNKGKVLEKIISLERYLGRELKECENMKNNEVCSEIYKTFSKEPEVLAIFNNGAAVVGMDVEGSDIDFVIVVKKKEDEEKVRKIFRKKYKILKNEEDPEIEVEEQYEVLGKRVDPTIVSKEEIEKKVYALNKSKENFLELQHFIKHKIIDSEAIFDSEKLLPMWKKEVEKYPRKLMQEIFDSQIESIKENLFYWRHHKFRNEFQFGFEQWDLVKGICQALYAKNNRMFMLPYKRLHRDLKELKPNIEKEMYELIRGRNTPEMIKKKIEIVEKILRRLER